MSKRVQSSYQKKREYNHERCGYGVLVNDRQRECPRLSMYIVLCNLEDDGQQECEWPRLCI